LVEGVWDRVRSKASSSKRQGGPLTEGFLEQPQRFYGMFGKAAQAP